MLGGIKEAVFPMVQPGPVMPESSDNIGRVVPF